MTRSTSPLAFCLLAVGLSLATMTSCKSKEAATDSTARTERGKHDHRGEHGHRGERGQRPSIDQVFEMDADADGRLSQTEVRGPLHRDFARIDADGDGFLTRAEVEAAPRRRKRELEGLKWGKG